jgi:hypothetical protein
MLAAGTVTALAAESVVRALGVEVEQSQVSERRSGHTFGMTPKACFAANLLSVGPDIGIHIRRFRSGFNLGFARPSHSRGKNSEENDK